jgi:Phage integrase, N-terminal SAM-like domain
MSKRHEGIEIRHEATCRSRDGGRCTCSPSYRAKVYDGRSERYIKKTFRSSAEARFWRTDALAAIRAGTLSGAPVPILAEAAESWVAGARSGAIRNRSGDVYKPSAIRGYEQALRLRVVPALGRMKLSEVRRSDLQAFVDRLLDADHDPSTIRNTLMPVRAIFRRALVRGEVAINPTAVPGGIRQGAGKSIACLELVREPERKGSSAPRKVVISAISSRPGVSTERLRGSKASRCSSQVAAERQLSVRTSRNDSPALVPQVPRARGGGGLSVDQCAVCGVLP